MPGLAGPKAKYRFRPELIPHRAHSLDVNILDQNRHVTAPTSFISLPVTVIDRADEDAFSWKLFRVAAVASPEFVGLDGDRPFNMGSFRPGKRRELAELDDPCALDVLIEIFFTGRSSDVRVELVPGKHFGQRAFVNALLALQHEHEVCLAARSKNASYRLNEEIACESG